MSLSDRLRHLSAADARTLVACSAAASLLVWGAVFLSAMPATPGTLGAAVVTSTSPDGKLTISANPGAVASGGTATITWSASVGSGAPAATIKCLGNAFGACVDNPLQKLSTNNAYGAKAFQIGATQYLAVANASGATSPVYVFMTGSNCFGNGTTCGTALQNIPTNAARDVEPFAIGTATYLAIANNSGSTSGIYVWQSAQNCFGNGTTCGTALQNISTSGGYDMQATAIGASTYLFASANTSPSKLYVWQSAQNCFGNGTTCGTALQSITTSSARGGLFFAISGTTYLAVANASGSTSPLFKWIPSKNCFGKDTASSCGTALQSLNSAGGFKWGFISDPQDVYLAIANASGPPSNVYKWQPSQACFGNGTTCGTTYQIINVATGHDWTSFSQGGNTYAFISNAASAGSNLYMLAPTNCFSNGATCGALYQGSGGGYRGVSFTKNNTLYMTEGQYTYVWTTGAGCPAYGGWGNGTACGSYLQDIGTRFFYQNLFTQNGELYIGLSPLSTSNNVGIYKWTASGSGCPAGGGWGNGSACSTPYQNLAMSWPFNVKPFTVNNTLYLGVPNLNTSTWFFKWTASGAHCPSGGGFGNGSDCAYGSTPGTNALGALGSGSGFLETFSIGGTPFLVRVVNNSLPTDDQLYKWTTVSGCPSGGGWGNGTACGAALQNFSTDGGTRQWRAFASGGNSYLLFAKGINASTNPPALLFKWIPSKNCFGKDAASNCGTPLQTLNSAKSSYAVATYLVGSRRFAFIAGTPGGTGSGNAFTFSYLWMPQNECFGDGVACDSPYLNNSGGGAEIYGETDDQFDSVPPNSYVSGTSGTAAVWAMLVNAGSSATSCIVTDSSGATVGSGTSGSATVGPIAAEQTYTLNCGSAGSVSVPVKVQSTSPLINADPVSVAAGNSSAITWSASGADAGACSVLRTSPSGTQSLFATANTGSAQSTGALSESGNYTYTLGCSDTKLLLHMDGAAGGSAFTDSSASPHPITTSGPTTSGSGAAAFSYGTLTTPDRADLELPGDFTIDLWVNPSDPSATATIYSKSGYWIWMSGGSFWFLGTSNGSAWDIATAWIGTAVGNTWQHLAVSRSGNTFYYFKNGALSGTSSSSLAPADLTDSLTLGTSFSGGIDEARVTKGQALWTAAFTPANPAPAPTDAASASTTVTVSSASITAPANAITNTPYTVSWQTAGVTAGSCHVDSPSGHQLWTGDNGSQSTSTASAGAYVYTLTCGAPAGTITKSATVQVVAGNNAVPALVPCTGGAVPPSCSFLVAPSKVRKGGTTTLSWNVTGLASGQSCSIGGNPASSLVSPLAWSGSGSTWSGSAQSAGIAVSGTFTLTCVASDGVTKASLSQTITVLPSFIEI